MGFVFWYYSIGLKKFLQIWKNFLEFFQFYFSLPELTLTLFSPWKRDVSRVGLRGFHPVILFHKLVENVFTRFVGAIVRSCVIFTGVVVVAGIAILGLFFLLVYLANPLALLISFGTIYSSQWSDPFFQLSELALLASVIIFVISIKSYRKDLADPADLGAIADKKWFSRIWNRIGLKEELKDAPNLSDPGVLKEFLGKIDMTPQEFHEIMAWEIKEKLFDERKSRFWLRENLMSSSPIGKHWSYAYTVHLDKYARDLSEGDWSQYRNARLIGKEKDLNELMLILTRPSQNNVILVGEPGVGRDTIVHTLAREIRENRITGDLARKRILEIDLKEVLANFPDAGDKDGILNELFSEAAYAGNVIIFIKNIDEYMDHPENNYDISSVLAEFLAFPSFQIIGTTTPAQYHSVIEKKGNIIKYCDKITIEEMNAHDTILVMLYKLKSAERKQIFFTYQGLREIVRLSDRYISNSPYPEKALDLMEEVMLHWSKGSDKPFIDAQVVDEALSNKIKVPLGEIAEEESEKLLNLENVLHQRVIGQNLAIAQIAQTMRRARVGMASDKKPLGSFLFLGPTGVGKTESAKALAQAYFGDEDRMIRLDMSEYQNPDAIDRLIGSSGSGREGVLINKVKENPFGLLLLDEIEKAYPDLLNLFLQVLDEGHMTDAFGKKISFKNLIIIATSNAGAEIIKEEIESGTETAKIQEKVVDFVIKKNIFRPELLNRFEGVIFFHPLSPDDIHKVTAKLLDNYASELKDKENVSISFLPDVIPKVSSLAYDPVFGARAIDRFIQDKIGDMIVKKIISGEVKKGSAIDLGAQDIN